MPDDKTPTNRRSDLDYLINQFIGTVHQQKKPRWQDTPPVWKEQLILGLQSQNDLRYFTQIRCWIKPPTQRFPTSACFLSLVNAKGSVFVKLNNIDELKALSTALNTWIPAMELKLQELSPLEAQMVLANRAFDTVINQPPDNSEPPGSIPDYDSEPYETQQEEDF